MISPQASGTQEADLGVEHTLTTLTGPRTYTLMVDLSDMEVVSDVVELRTEVQVVESGPWVRSYSQQIWGSQVDAGFISIPVPSPYGCRFILKQVSGTERSFPWSVIALD